MNSSATSLTPLGFARDYQAYRRAAGASRFADSRLLAAARFWTAHSAALESVSYSSFWLEDLPPLLTLSSKSLSDLGPDELGEIARFVGSLTPELTSALKPAPVWTIAAEKWLCVGEVSRAIGCIVKAGLCSDDLASEVSQIVDEPTNLPSRLAALCREDDIELRQWLTRIDAEWRATRQSGHVNQAMCVLVERDVSGKAIRGRLRTLEAHVEQLPKERDADEIVFGHQLAAADDPQVRGAYAAVASLRLMTPGTSSVGTVIARSEATKQSALQSSLRIPHSFLRARFTFANGGNHEPYGGDSLGFACLVTAYGDLWSKDLHRERRLVSTSVALTGAISERGEVQPVSDATLAKKIERVFFSPLSHLVIPQANRTAAEAELLRLHGLYPRRRLRLITIERTTDLTSDGNITIPERICLGEYAVRAAAKYSRSVKVQVPVLTVLAYLLLCLLYPKAWVGFDRVPFAATLSANSIHIMNRAGRELWVRNFASTLQPVTRVRFGDFDRDGNVEVAILANTVENESSEIDAQLMVFEGDGSLVFQRDTRILGEYPGDTSASERYEASLLEILNLQERTVFLTGVNASFPSRSHIRFWSATGESLGWYVNAGQISGEGGMVYVAPDGYVWILGFNNRMGGCAALMILNPDSTTGCSPPYVDSVYELARVRRGNQRAYVVLPRTDVNRATRQVYSIPSGIEEITSGAAWAKTFELGHGSGGVYYLMDSQHSVATVSVDDLFWTRRSELVSRGELENIERGEYCRQLRGQVLVWTDSCWVNDPSK